MLQLPLNFPTPEEAAMRGIAIAASEHEDDHAANAHKVAEIEAVAASLQAKASRSYPKKVRWND